MGTYTNPYTWTDVNGDEHTHQTRCTNQETVAECQARHDADVALSLDQWPPAPPSRPTQNPTTQDDPE